MYYEVVDRVGMPLAYCNDLADADIVMKRHNDAGQGAYIREARVTLAVVTNLQITYANGTQAMTPRIEQGERRMRDMPFILPRKEQHP